MIIVVLLVGILAMAITWQIGGSTSEANLNTLRTNLRIIRNAIELYYHQHDNAYPGTLRVMDTIKIAEDSDLHKIFILQLTTYTQSDGRPSTKRDSLTPPIFGPYLKTPNLPLNPFNNSSKVTFDIKVTDVTVRTASPSDGTGWKFYVNTGVFIANDSAAHAAY